MFLRVPSFYGTRNTEYNMGDVSRGSLGILEIIEIEIGYQDLGRLGTRIDGENQDQDYGEE